MKIGNGRVARDLALLQGARRENILYGSLTDEQRSSSDKDRQPGGLFSILIWVLKTGVFAGVVRPYGRLSFKVTSGGKENQTYEKASPNSYGSCGPSVDWMQSRWNRSGRNE